jgi:hypothetical protein
MTYDKNTENAAASDRFEHHHGPYGRNDAGQHGRDGMSWATRPGFHPLKALTVLGGFAIFPPLGVLALGYFLWNSRSSFGRHYGPGPQQFAGGPGMGQGRCGPRGMRGRFTGNAAFDEHQAEEINKLREERRAFFEYRMAERRKRDQQAYDAFRSAQTSSSEGDDNGPVKA